MRALKLAGAKKKPMNVQCGDIRCSVLRYISISHGKCCLSQCFFKYIYVNLNLITENHLLILRQKLKLITPALHNCRVGIRYHVPQLAIL